MANIISVLSTELPPLLTKGSVTPVSGIIFMPPPMVRKICAA